ncbi:MAG: TetR/AcrR family transcriptional regulator C-terminal domain-containing protein [Myxococcales bacterium]|nr:TetR/AcrR family transcriptional regulator C-terminal domain-containing protein [Myxococcales bacterium]MCB9628819.1 TetR/AcrR family transcriptional regulator C-terminal domain-containing protein [Sandaracinaceae bacterium]
MSTRGRLSRERILEDALRIVDSEGLQGLTIRRLAQELDVTPMAVYRHFKNKTDILDGLIELVIAEGQATEHDTEGWQAWIEVTFLRMRASLLQHPGVLPLLGSSASYGLQSLRITERLLGKLRGAGLGADAVARGLHLLVSYTLGAVAIEVAAREQQQSAEAGTQQEWQRQLRQRFESADIAEFPNLVALAPKLSRFVEEAEFGLGVRQIIRSLTPEA